MKQTIEQTWSAASSCANAYIDAVNSVNECREKKAGLQLQVIEAKNRLSTAMQERDEADHEETRDRLAEHETNGAMNEAFQARERERAELNAAEQNLYDAALSSKSVSDVFKLTWALLAAEERFRAAVTLAEFKEEEFKGANLRHIESSKQRNEKAREVGVRKNDLSLTEALLQKETDNLPAAEQLLRETLSELKHAVRAFAPGDRIPV